MRRLLVTTSLALTFAAASACNKKEEENKTTTAKADKGKASKAAGAGGKDAAEKPEVKTPEAAPAPALLELVPEGAKVLVSADIARIKDSPIYHDQTKAIAGTDIGKRIEAATACNLGPETWKQLVMGATPDNDDATMMGMAATGIGKKANIECIAAKYKEEDPAADWKIEDKDGRTMATINGGEAIAYAVDDDTLVMVGKPWDAAVQERMSGKGSAAVAGSLKGAMALVDSSKPVFVAGLATPDMATGPLTGAQYFGGAIELADGVSLDVSIAFADGAAAQSKAGELKAQFEGFKPMAQGMGAPQGMVDSVKIEAADANVNLSIKATTQELEQLNKTISGMMQAGG